MSILINLLLGVFVVVCLLLVLIILMQRPKSEGLGAAFGASVTENIFGAQTTNVLTKITGWLAGIFFVVTFALAVLYAHKSTSQSALRRELAKTQASPAPTVSAAVSPSPAATQVSSSPVASPVTTASPGATSAAASPAISPSPTAKP
ncbi:MAG: preprotein translocase subunit SecG [Chthoniobacterales bacterium]